MNEYLVVIIVMAVALAMDAFAVAITLGMDGAARTIRQRLEVATSFGFFQGLLFLLGINVLHFVSGSMTTYNSYIAGAILIILGIRMTREGFEEHEDTCPYEGCQHKKCKEVRCLKTGKMKKLTLQLLVMYGIATSIDALAAGITYGLIYNQILIPAICISLVAFVFSYVGASFGKTLGHIIGSKANVLGGVLLIFLGLKSVFF